MKYQDTDSNYFVMDVLDDVDMKALPDGVGMKPLLE